MMEKNSMETNNRGYEAMATVKRIEINWSTLLRKENSDDALCCVFVCIPSCPPSG